MTPEQATEFAARITRAIGRQDMAYGTLSPATVTDREHVAAFLSAYQRANHALAVFASHPTWWTEARDEAWAGLVRIGSNYGKKP